MRVCMLAYTFYESDNRVRRYAEALAERGDEVEVVALRKQGQPRQGQLKGVTVHRIQERQFDEKGKFSYLTRLVLFLLRSCFFMTRKHLSKRYDLIHIHNLPDFLVFAGWPAKLLGAKLILDIHDILPELFLTKFKADKESFWFRCLLFVERISARAANHVVIANHIWHDRISQRAARPEKCSVILNYPNLKVFYPRETTETSDRFVLVYPGTLSWHQGVDVAIRALASLKERLPTLEFRIYGEGQERDSLLGLTRELGLEGRVLFKGAVPIEEVAQAMSNADLCVEPKRASSFADEALSTKIFEFMALRVPVLASDTAAHKRYFDDSNVEFFASEDEEDLGQGILRLWESPERRRSLIESASRLVAENSWERRKADYLELVDRLTGKSEGKVPIDSAA